MNFFDFLGAIGTGYIIIFILIIAIVVKLIMAVINIEKNTIHIDELLTAIAKKHNIQTTSEQDSQITDFYDSIS